MLGDLDELFRSTAEDGIVRMEYDTKVYLGNGNLNAAGYGVIGNGDCAPESPVTTSVAASHA
mgnify:CR=1 FL=1